MIIISHLSVSILRVPVAQRDMHSEIRAAKRQQRPRNARPTEESFIVSVVSINARMASYSCINFLTLLLPRRVKVPTTYQLSLRPPNLDQYMMSRAL